MASSVEDAYTAGQLSQLLLPRTVDASDSTTDAALTSLFTSRPEPPKPAKRPDEELLQHQLQQKKKKKKQQQQQLASDDPDRATGKARVKLARVREKARADDPRNGRTVFVGNVASAAKKRDLLVLFRQHGPIESVRFRSAAPADAGVVKRLAVIHKKLSRPSLNAYLVYKEPESVAKAIHALNGHCLSGMHLRVDWLPGSEGFQKDNGRCVFLGNLRFNCDEESVRAAFGKCGRVTNVRLVRDSRSGIGRGFGFVQFADAAAVELALKLAGTELAGRPVRVTRCSDSSKSSSMSQQQQQSRSGPNAETPAVAATKKPPKKEKKRRMLTSGDGAATGRKGGGGGGGGNRPTNRTFAQAFQRMLDVRRGASSGGGGGGGGIKKTAATKRKA